MNTGMSIVPAFMWILLPENLCLSLPTSLIQVAGGQAFPNRFKRSNRRKKDTSHGMIRTEVRSKTGDAHLGHVFTDGPKRKVDYAIASIALHFVLSRKIKWKRKVMENIYHSLNRYWRVTKADRNCSLEKQNGGLSHKEIHRFNVVKLKREKEFHNSDLFYLLAVSRVASLVAGVDTFIAQLAADSSIHLSFHL